MPIFQQVRRRLTSSRMCTELETDSRAACLVLLDLLEQGWILRRSTAGLEIRRPETDADSEAERVRVRRQLHAARNHQLVSDAVRNFIAEMEKRQFHRGRWTSIFSLMRDGEELSARLRRTLDQGSYSTILNAIIRPYIQVVTEGATCEFTGLPLVNIWRYFRHTWANPYNSVPGRSAMFLVRDAAADRHPVIGIFALASSSVQIKVRDQWIGWDPESQVTRLRQVATDEDVEWLGRLIQQGLDEIYLEDLLDPSLSLLILRDLSSPRPGVLRSLTQYAKAQREEHNRLVDASIHKRNAAQPNDEGADRWKFEAETPLYRSKRAETVALLLRAREALQSASCKMPATDLAAALNSPNTRQAIQSLIRRAKSERVGTAIADIAVCGAVPPYSCLLGGKLVAMLAASPEVLRAYGEKYAAQQSVIASSLAGRPIVRPTHLVFLGTTSLYGMEPTQYTRIKIPCDRLGGKPDEYISYRLLGRTEGFGTSQFSRDTVEAFSLMLAQKDGGQRVHSIFGEGVNPRLRKIRDGLDALGLSSDLLLSHGSPRLVYGIALARNFRRYLLGLDTEPEYLFPIEEGQGGTAAIAAWWAERWLVNRIKRAAVLRDVARHTLKYPVRHGARVPFPETAEPELPFANANDFVR